MKNKLTYECWDDLKVKEMNSMFADFMDVIKWAFKKYEDRIIYSCSFGAEAMVLIDLISKVNSEAKIVFLDTDLHFTETYTLIEKVKQRYPALQIKIVQPTLTLTEQAKLHGDNLWEKNPNLCCYIRKIEPLKKELANVDAWFSGIRREQSSSRKNTEYINKENKFKRIKICPLIHWTWDEVWNYIRLNNLPYNELHDKSYPSIGCEMCTLPIIDSENLRAGRWANFDKQECGLHQS